MTTRRWRALRCLSLVLPLLVASLLAGCGPRTSGTKLAPPVVPEKADFRAPEAAVRTYLDYTSFAYRMANSDLASRAATPYEGVRVDSYVELNRQQDQGIEQQLVKFTKRSESEEGTRALFAASEEWRYRYFSLSKREYTSPMYTASYEATYTLVRDAAGWLVDKVDARPLAPVK